MHRTHACALVIACAALGSLPATGCGGAVDPGSGGGRSGVVSGSSSGSIGSGSSSGAPAPSPQCAGLPAPTIAEVCPDGTSVGGYYAWDGKQCVLSFDCPPVGQPEPFPGTGPGYPGGSSGSSGGPITAPPSTCNFPLPNVCEACSNGETICAHYAIQNGTCVVEICPPSYVPPPMPVPGPVPVGGSCSQGASCGPGEGCGTASSPGTYACSTSCNCDYTGHFQCSTVCPSPVPPPPPPYPYPISYPPTGGCAQGAKCSPNSGCGGGPDAYGCFESCTCDYYGTMQCTYACPSYDAGVADASYYGG